MTIKTLVLGAVSGAFIVACGGEDKGVEDIVDVKIEAYGPPPTSGAGTIFYKFVMDMLDSALGIHSI